MLSAKIKKDVWYAVLAFLLTALVYLPSIRYDFITYDDLVYVLENEHMRQGLTLSNVKWALASRTYASNWHPLAWISMMADVSLGQGCRLSPEAWMQTGNRISYIMHAHNVILHAANAALLLLIVSCLCKGRLKSSWQLAFVLIWSLHPLRTEAVCWVSERKEVLCVLFMLVSVMCYFKDRYWCSFLCGILAALAKPVAVTLPVVLLAYDIVLCGKRRMIRMIPFFIVSAFTCMMTIGAQTVAIECGTAQGTVSRLSSIFGAPIIYLCQTLWPTGLSAVYAVRSPPDLIPIGMGVALVAALILILCQWSWRFICDEGKGSPVLNILVFAIAWVYVGLMPMLGIVKVGWQEHSDRYTYWIGCGASACLALLLAAKGEGWVKKTIAWVESVDHLPFDRAKARRAIFASACCLVGLLATLTFLRMPVWSGPIPFLRDSIQKSWSLDFASVMSKTFRNYGPEYVAEAEHWLRKCATKHTGVEANVILAEFLIWKGSDDEAMLLLEEVLQTDPNQKAANEMMAKLRGRAFRGTPAVE